MAKGGAILVTHPVVEFVRQARNVGTPAAAVASMAADKFGVLIDRHTMPRIVRDERNTCLVCDAEFYAQRAQSGWYNFCPHCLENVDMKTRREAKEKREALDLENRKAVPDELKGWGHLWIEG